MTRDYDAEMRMDLVKAAVKGINSIRSRLNRPIPGVIIDTSNDIVRDTFLEMGGSVQRMAQTGPVTVVDGCEIDEPCTMLVFNDFSVFVLIGESEL